MTTPDTHTVDGQEYRAAESDEHGYGDPCAHCAAYQNTGLCIELPDCVRDNIIWVKA